MTAKVCEAQAADSRSGRVGRLVIAHKDRLLRFRAELVFAICEAKDVELLTINQGVDTTFEEDLAKDVLEIITMFSARLYGSRSRLEWGRAFMVLRGEFQRIATAYADVEPKIPA